MFKGHINEKELSKAITNLEIGLVNHAIALKNAEYEERRTESLGTSHYAYRPAMYAAANIDYDISFGLDLFDKHYKGIKNFKISWDYREAISYDQILKIYNLNSEQQTKAFYNTNFFKQLIAEYRQWNIDDSLYNMRFRELMIENEKDLVRFRISSRKNRVLSDVDEFFRKTHRMLYESAHIMKNVKDFYC